MNIDQYSKITATISAQLESMEKVAIIITSSSNDIDVLSVGNGICSSFAHSGKKVLLLDCLIGEQTMAKKSEVIEQAGFFTLKLLPSENPMDIISDLYVKDLLSELETSYDVIFICCEAVALSAAAMYFTAQSNGVVLVEQRKVSRTDHIDETIEIIKNLNAEALGFILV